MESGSVGIIASTSEEPLEDQAPRIIRLRAACSLDPDFQQFAEKEFRELFHPILGLLSSQTWGPTRRYVSDVIVLEPGTKRRPILEWLTRAGTDHPGGFYGFVEEETHIHVFHDCPYSNSSCRCRWKNHGVLGRLLKKPIRRPRFVSLFDWVDWVYVILYFFLYKRNGQKEIWVTGRVRRLSCLPEDIRWKVLLERSREILARKGERAGPDTEQEGPPDGEGEQTVSRSLRTAAPKRGRFENICAKTSFLLNKYLCIPLTDVRKIVLPSNPDHELCLHDPVNERHYLSACKLFSQSINAMTLLELKNLLSKTQPVFYSNSASNPYKYYHTREESFEFLLNLIKFQFNNDSDKIKDLLSNIVSWFNKKGWYTLNDKNEYILNSKLNTICVIGPPNAGKNYFWDCFSAIALNVGHIGRVNNKCNQFALQEVVDKRLIIGNEINMEDGAKDDFKKLCEGKALNVRIKHSPDGIYYRTPVLLLSNNVLDICNDPTFRNVRIKVFYWKKCEMLKHSTKQPYPMAIFDVFDYYNISIQ